MYFHKNLEKKLTNNNLKKCINNKPKDYLILILRIKQVIKNKN
jgi:hypothetical protein